MGFPFLSNCGCLPSIAGGLHFLLEQVITMMRSMDESTQQNDALAEETSAASVSMGEQVAKWINH